MSFCICDALTYWTLVFDKIESFCSLVPIVPLLLWSTAVCVSVVLIVSRAELSLCWTLKELIARGCGLSVKPVETPLCRICVYMYCSSMHCCLLQCFLSKLLNPTQRGLKGYILFLYLLCWLIKLRGFALTPVLYSEDSLTADGANFSCSWIWGLQCWRSLSLPSCGRHWYKRHLNLSSNWRQT